MYCSIKQVKETIPADRLCLIRLEDGLGWEQICPFLDKPIPKEPYPEPNDPKMFEAIVEELVNPCMKRATLRLGAIVVTVLGVVGWSSMKYWPSLVEFLTR